MRYHQHGLYIDENGFLRGIEKIGGNTFCNARGRRILGTAMSSFNLYVGGMIGNVMLMEMIDITTT